MRNLSKIILLIGLILSATNACKRDDLVEPVVRDLPCLLTKITTTFDDGNHSKTMEYDKYHRLVKIIDYSSDYSILDYNKEDKLSKITKYIDKVASWQITYNWKGNSLIMIGEPLLNNSQLGDGSKSIFEFNAYNQVIKEILYSKFNDKYDYSGHILYTLENGNISSAEFYDELDEYYKTASYEYDDKPNAYYSFEYYFGDSFRTLTKNNATKCVITHADGKVDVLWEERFEYNDRGYPIKRKYLYKIMEFDTIVSHFEYDSFE